MDFCIYAFIVQSFILMNNAAIFIVNCLVHQIGETEGHTKQTKTWFNTLLTNLKENKMVIYIIVLVSCIT